MKVSVERLGSGPIIRPNMDSLMGDNVNGPSLIQVPDWLPNALGRYYLYFAHHDGRYIRMAYADELTGPWRTHESGVLPLKASHYKGHIASPDVHVDHAERRIRMYFHGADFESGVLGPQGRQPQYSRVALSSDGLEFTARPAILGRAYMRAIRRDDWHLVMAMPGIFYRSKDGLSDFEQGPTLFDANMRHGALLNYQGGLYVFYSSVGEVPERILLSEIDTTGGVDNWLNWTNSAPQVVLEPERDYEGGELPLAPSERGLIYGPVRQLRDPAIFVEDGQHFLVYSVAGEHGLALARLTMA